MTPQEREQHRQQLIAEAMSGLIMDTRFQVFMNIVQEQREVAIEDLKRDDVVSDERKLLAAVGEVRVYDSILAAYREFRSREAI